MTVAIFCYLLSLDNKVSKASRWLFIVLIMNILGCIWKKYPYETLFSLQIKHGVSVVLELQVGITALEND